LKRKLQVLGEPGEPTFGVRRLVNLGQVTVSVADAGDGSATARFVDELIEPGAAPTDAAADFSIVIRTTPGTSERRLQESALEEGADLILGSARPVFAKLFGSACARWVNS
jgi:hypothetical protein